MTEKNDTRNAFRGEAAEVYARLVDRGGRRVTVPNDTIVRECNDLARRYGVVVVGGIEFVEFPDGSRLAWTPGDGFIHPLNGGNRHG